MRIITVLFVILFSCVVFANEALDKIKHDLDLVKIDVESIKYRIHTDPFAYDLRLREIVHKSTQNITNLEKNLDDLQASLVRSEQITNADIIHLREQLSLTKTELIDLINKQLKDVKTPDTSYFKETIEAAKSIASAAGKSAENSKQTLDTFILFGGAVNAVLALFGSAFAFFFMTRLRKIDTTLKNADEKNSLAKEQLDDVKNKMLDVERSKKELELAYKRLNTTLKNHSELHNDFILTIFKISDFIESYSVWLTKKEDTSEGNSLRKQGLQLLQNIEHTQKELEKFIDNKLMKEDIRYQLTSKKSYIYSCLGIIEYYANQYKQALAYLLQSKEVNVREHPDRYINIIAVCAVLHGKGLDTDNQYLQLASDNYAEMLRRNDDNIIRRMGDDADVKKIISKLRKMNNQGDYKRQIKFKPNSRSRPKKR